MVKRAKEKAVDIVRRIDKHKNFDREVHHTVMQMTEEFGELVRDINNIEFKQVPTDRKNLEGEFADLFMLLLQLSHQLDVDLEKAMDNKIAVLEKRFGV